MFDIVISVGLEDDKPRGGSAREQRRLRPSIAEEPSSSYAYHDEQRVEKVRTASAAPANDAHPPARASLAQASAAKPSTAGRGAQSPGPLDSLANMVSPSIRTVTTGTRTKPRPALSEPPDIGSWPPLPDVPDQLVKKAEDAVRTRHESDSAPTDPPKTNLLGRTPPGGAIWSAMPSMVGQAPDEEIAGPVSDEPPAPVEAAIAASRVEIVSQPDAPRPIMVETYRDPELKRFEPLVERGAWESLAKELKGEAGHSPEYRLLRVLAQRETLPVDDKAAGRLTQDAISALAELLGVPGSSPTALMLAKRLLRRNPVWTQTKPSSRLSAGVVIVGLLVGAGLGWLLTHLTL